MTARHRLSIRRTEPGVWAYIVIQHHDRLPSRPVSWGWSRHWPETLVRGLAAGVARRERAGSSGALGGPVTPDTLRTTTAPCPGFVPDGPPDPGRRPRCRCGVERRNHPIPSPRRAADNQERQEK